jgi:hypothetical protein
MEALGNAARFAAEETTTQFIGDGAVAQGNAKEGDDKVNGSKGSQNLAT